MSIGGPIQHTSGFTPGENLTDLAMKYDRKRLHTEFHGFGQIILQLNRSQPSSEWLHLLQDISQIAVDPAWVCEPSVRALRRFLHVTDAYEITHTHEWDMLIRDIVLECMEAREEIAHTIREETELMKLIRERRQALYSVHAK